MASGETCSYGATVRYGTRSLMEEEPARCALKGFRSSGTTFSLDVECPKDHLPSRMLQIRRPSYNKGHEIVVRELAINTWGMVTMVVEHTPSPGCTACAGNGDCGRYPTTGDPDFHEMVAISTCRVTWLVPEPAVMNS
ncbi:hypothetical protein BKA23_2819 [Rudaeicoccus suwonensis]|uniref:Uncharacterized protein n=1 Tax=Rudaeicoccus suwonensis TaxID=657409 RepID=A0A561E4B7_9MICO|nr:hypothetical protein BKA23_2819 [Rudaeicoccus suwonensis]